MSGVFPGAISAQDVCQQYEGGAFDACELGVSMQALGNVCSEYYASSPDELKACEDGFNAGKE